MRARFIAGIVVLVLGLPGLAAAAESAASSGGIAVRSGVDLSPWGRLLGKYVDDRGLVAYARWKASREDLAALDSFLKELAAPATRPAVGAQRLAVLVNAYNALTISWVLRNFPTASIRSLSDSFSSRRHVIGGRNVSLDDIESDLRREGGYRIHSAISCASRSCPPLAVAPYRAASLESQLDEAMRRWLSRDDLNSFLPERKKVEISMIFQWYGGDFQGARGGLRGVLAAFAPERFRSFLRGETYAIEFRPYDWSLNGVGP